MPRTMAFTLLCACDARMVWYASVYATHTGTALWVNKVERQSQQVLLSDNCVTEVVLYSASRA